MLDYKSGLDILFCAQKQVEEEKLYMRWVAGPQFEMSLDAFRKKLGGAIQDQDNSAKEEAAEEESAEEILERVRKIAG